MSKGFGIRFEMSQYCTVLAMHRSGNIVKVLRQGGGVGWYPGEQDAIGRFENSSKIFQMTVLCHTSVDQCLQGGEQLK